MFLITYLLIITYYCARNGRESILFIAILVTFRKTYFMRTFRRLGAFGPLDPPWVKISQRNGSCLQKHFFPQAERLSFPPACATKVEETLYGFLHSDNYFEQLA